MQSSTPRLTRPPTLASKVAGRILAVLVGAAVVALLTPVFDSLNYSVLLLSYILIILAPLLVFLGWRLVGLWRLGLRRLPSRQARRAYLWTAAAFVSLTVLVYSLESWRGRRAYAALKREVEAQGTSLDLAAVIPPTVPDADNFCDTPILRKMVDYDYEISSLPLLREHQRWRDPEAIRRLREIQVPARQTAPMRSWLRGEFIDLNAWSAWVATNRTRAGQVTPEQPAEAMLEAMAGFEPELRELRTASQRPKARWPLRYEDGFFLQIGVQEREGFLRNLIHILVLRSVASLELGRTEAALTDWKVALRLAQSTKDEPSFFTHIWRVRLLSETIQPVWEGLARQRWSGEQLIELETSLGQIDLPADWRRALRGEVYLYMDLARRLPALFSFNALRQHCRALWSDDAGIFFVLGWLVYPRGWAYDDQVVIYRLYESLGAGRTLCCCTTEPPKAVFKPIDPLLLTFIFPRLRQILIDPEPFCFAQFEIESARVACALERYRQKQGAFPGDLKALVPQYLDPLPLAPGTQDPFLAYEPTPDGKFLLRPAIELNVPSWHRMGKNTKPVWRYTAEPTEKPASDR